jgi:NAD(P)H-dependent FMN reductase
MINLKLITASTRPGRRGIAVSEWMLDSIRANPAFQTQHLDLAEIKLPFMDEPHHPRMQKYTHQHTKDWSKTIAEADALIFVMPEYNHGIIAPLKNALDYLFREWAYKPAGIVSYGGLSAGIRATQMLKPILSALKMVPLVESVNIPFFESHIKDGSFTPTDSLNHNVEAMLQEIIRMEAVLRLLRV